LIRGDIVNGTNLSLITDIEDFSRKKIISKYTIRITIVKLTHI
jgi:hypothetical protein